MHSMHPAVPFHTRFSSRTLQHGHINPAIFSTTPNIGIPTLRQKLISLRTSNNDTSCGVVTITAPSTEESLRYVAIEMCSSEVPGGATLHANQECGTCIEQSSCCLTSHHVMPRSHHVIRTIHNKEIKFTPIDIS